jgi:hypothetical protein
MAVGTVIYLGKGFPERLPDSVVRLAQAREPSELNCHSLSSVPYGSKCMIGTAPPTFAVWGDSHAGSFKPVFEVASGGGRTSGLLFTANACPPLHGLAHRPGGREANDCVAYQREVLQEIDKHDIRKIFLIADWWSYEGDIFRNGNLASGLAATLGALKGRRVVIVHRVPGALLDVPSSLARSVLFDRGAEAGLPASEYISKNKSFQSTIDRLRHIYRFEDLMVHEKFCASTVCAVQLRGELLYTDYSHIRPAAAELLAPIFIRSLE